MWLCNIWLTGSFFFVFIFFVCFNRIAFFCIVIYIMAYRLCLCVCVFVCAGWLCLLNHTNWIHNTLCVIKSHRFMSVKCYCFCFILYAKHKPTHCFGNNRNENIFKQTRQNDGEPKLWAAFALNSRQTKCNSCLRLTYKKSIFN